MQFYMAWQPIIDLRDQIVAAFECLARGGPPGAAHVGQLLQGDDGWRLDMELVYSSLRTIGELWEQELLFINVAPGTVAAVLRGWVRLPDTPQVVWELSEHALPPGVTPPAIRRAFPAYALDDFGAGRCDLLRLLEWRPPWVKLDRAVVSGVSRDRTRQEIVRGVVAAASTYGARVVAEGIEEQPDLDAVAALGVRYGQGFLLGSPAPPSTWEHQPGVRLRQTGAAAAGKTSGEVAGDAHGN